MSLVFKCASDAFFLDDFKSVLDRIAKASIKDIANVPTGSTSGFKDDSAVRNPFSSGRRRLSSFGGIRRPSNAAPSRRQFSPGARVEHVSLNGDPTVDEEERAIIDSPSAPPKAHHSRDLWGTAGDTGTSSARFSTHCRPGESTSNGPRPGQILAETTITISENDEGRESPQEMRQSQTSSSRSDYLYGEGPRGEASLDPEMGMPLSSLRPKS